MNYTIHQISEVINGEIIGNDNQEYIIKKLLIDSRQLSNTETSLFFAIKGERHDGHTYLQELYEKGNRNFVVSRLPNNYISFSRANFIVVKDTLVALQQLCAYHREQFKIPVIAIGGIGPENINEVISTGVHGAAFIGSVLKSSNTVKTIKELRKKMYAAK